MDQGSESFLISVNDGSDAMTGDVELMNWRNADPSG